MDGSGGLLVGRDGNAVEDGLGEASGGAQREDDGREDGLRNGARKDGRELTRGRVLVDAEASGLWPSMNGAIGFVRSALVSMVEAEWRRRCPGMGRPGSGLPVYAWKGKVNEEGGWGILSTTGSL